MPSPQENQRIFRWSKVLFQLIRFKYGTKSADDLYTFYAGFRKIDNFLDEKLPDVSLFERNADAIKLSLLGSKPTHAGAVEANIQPIASSLIQIEDTMLSLNFEQQETINKKIFPMIFSAWKKDAQIAAAPFSHSAEFLAKRHEETIPAYMFMAQVLTHNPEVIDDEWQSLAWLAVAWAQLNHLEDLPIDTSRNTSHFPPEELASRNIFSIEDLRNMTPEIFYDLTSDVSHKLTKHLPDLENVTTWDETFRVFWRFFFKSRILRAQTLPFPKLK